MDITALRREAERLRRLARSITDDTMAEQLERLAREAEQRAAILLAGIAEQGPAAAEGATS